MTTTLKLKPALTRRIRALARKAGSSPHAWMVEAIEREAKLSEAREQFIAEAEAAAADIDAGGPVFAAEDVHAYILARATGKKARRPSPIGRPRRA